MGQAVEVAQQLAQQAAANLVSGRRGQFESVALKISGVCGADKPQQSRCKHILLNSVSYHLLSPEGSPQSITDG